MRGKEKFPIVFPLGSCPQRMPSLFPRKASSITRNLQTPSPCSILILLPFVFLCSSLPNFQTVLSLNIQMSLTCFYQTSRTILAEKISHGFLLPRLAVLSREAEDSYLEGGCPIEYSYRRLPPSTSFPHERLRHKISLFCVLRCCVCVSLFSLKMNVLPLPTKLNANFILENESNHLDCTRA